MKNWQEKIKKGLALIIEGCKENADWRACRDCSFRVLCDSIYKDEESPYSTPDCYEEEGLYQKKD